MKLLYLASTLLATATIAHTQATALIIFAVELIELEFGGALMFTIESSISLSSEVVEEELAFTAETNWAVGAGLRGGQTVMRFAPDVVVDDIDPVAINVVDEAFWGNVQWHSTIQAFGQDIPISLTTDITTQVIADEEGAAIFGVDGQIAPDGVHIRVDLEGFRAHWMAEDASVTFSPPAPT